MSIEYIEAIILAMGGAIGIGLIQFIKMSIKRELTQVIEETVKPEIQKINKRIDDHMDQEERDLKSLIKVLSKISIQSESQIKMELRDDS